MAEEQKVQKSEQKEAQKVVEPQKVTNNAPKPEEKKKMGIGAKIAIGCGVILLLVLIVLGGLAIAGVSFFSKVTEEFDGLETVIEEEYTEENEESETAEEENEEFLYKKSTEQGLDGDLESSDMLTDNFPEDIPLSGGKITASSRNDLKIVAELDVDATLEEVKQWYVDELRNEGWEISSQSESEPIEDWLSVDISFESVDGERRGDITIEQTPYTAIPHVRIRELLY